MDIIDRMFSLIDTKFDEQREFALAIHVDPAHVSRWRNRKSTSYQRRLPQIADVLGTTVQWLVTGEDVQKGQAAAASGEADAVAQAYEKADEKIRALVRLALGLD